MKLKHIVLRTLAGTAAEPVLHGTLRVGYQPDQGDQVCGFPAFLIRHVGVTIKRYGLHMGEGLHLVSVACDTTIIRIAQSKRGRFI